MTAQAKAEPLLASERQRSQKTLEEHTEKWEAALCNVTNSGEEAVETERTITGQAEAETNIFRLRLAREEELQQARRTEGQVGSGAPSFTPTLTHQQELIGP